MMSDGSKLNPNEMKLSGSKYIFVNLMSAPDKLLMVPLKLNWNGMEKAAASKLEWMMQQTSSALALEKIDDNGMVLNGWLARIHHGQKKRASPCLWKEGTIKTTPKIPKFVRAQCYRMFNRMSSLIKLITSIML